MKEFKEGDLVYCPIIGNNIYKLTGTISLASLQIDREYPIGINKDNEHIPFQKNGFYHPKHKKPSLFHATPKNHAKLEAFYEEEFEKPPVAPSPKEIIQAMLKRGDKCVCCWVSDAKENPTADDRWTCITSYIDGSYPFAVSTGSAWKYATPFDPRTGEAITELPNE